jgi:hypothetical protein
MLRTRSGNSPAYAATLVLLALAGCGRQPDAPKAQSPQPDTVVTSRSDGKAIANPRRGSFKKSDPKAKGGYRSPD